MLGEPCICTVSSRELSVKEVLRIHEEEQFQLSEFSDQLTERLYKGAWDDKHSTERCCTADLLRVTVNKEILPGTFCLS